MNGDSGQRPGRGWPDAETALGFETVMLELRKVAAQTRIGPGVIETMTVSVKRDVLSGLIINLCVEVLSQHIDSHTETASKDVEFTLPASWWQHYKRDVLTRFRLTRWFVRWRPVRETTVTKTAVLSVTWRHYATFPEASVVVDPRLGQHRFQVIKEQPVWKVTP